MQKVVGSNPISRFFENALHVGGSAEREDAGLLFGLIRGLADYEEFSDAVAGDAELLAAALFDRTGTEA